MVWTFKYFFDADQFYLNRNAVGGVVSIWMYIYFNLWFNPLYCFFGSEGHVALDRKPGTGDDALLLRLIPGDFLSAFSQRQYINCPDLGLSSVLK